MGRFAAIGKRLQDFDDKYAEKVRNLIMTKSDGSAGATIRNTIGAFAGSPVAYAAPTIRMDEARAILKAGIPMGMAERALGSIPGAVGFTARYAAPAGLITAAGAGLADLTQNFYDSMANTPVLPS